MRVEECTPLSSPAYGLDFPYYLALPGTLPLLPQAFYRQHFQNPQGTA
jgi:hypothetical protein